MKLLSLILLLFNLTQMHEAGFRGEGMTIAVIDAGFFRANDSTVFPQEQIVGVYDLLAGDTTAVDTFGMFSDPDNPHGAMVLSTMLYQDSAAGFVGTAPGANYILIRSEDKYAEYYGEVERLVRAFRLADSMDSTAIPDIRQICPDAPPDLALLIAGMSEKSLEKRIRTPDLLLHELKKIHIQQVINMHHLLKMELQLIHIRQLMVNKYCMIKLMK